MARTFERNRERIIEAVSENLDTADNSRVQKMILKVCRNYDVPATNRDIQDAANEAVRRRMVVKFLQLKNQLNTLKNRVDGYHPGQ